MNLIGHKGNIRYIGNDWYEAIPNDGSEPVTFTADKLHDYIVKMHIHSSDNGQIQLGIWEKEED